MGPEKPLPIPEKFPTPFNPVITGLGIYPEAAIRAMQKGKKKCTQMLIVVLFYKSKNVAFLPKNLGV